MPMLDGLGDAGFLQNELLKALASSSAGGTDASPLIKEDLEMEAHTQLWLETSEIEMVILKHMPRIAATSVIHEYDQIVGYGPRILPFYGETTLPPDSTIVSRRRQEIVKLQGYVSSVFALASFQTPVQALGANNLVDQNMAATRLNLLRGMAVSIYMSDNSTSTDINRYRGLKQQILEGTSVSTTFPFTVNTQYIIDLRGAPLLAPEIRTRARQIGEHYGQMSWVYMALSNKEQLERSIDPSERLILTREPALPVVMGQNVDGMMTAGGIVRFAPDNTLTATEYGGTAPTTAVPNAPAPLTAANVAAPTAAANPLSLWVAADADPTVLYTVTALNSSGESTGYSPATVAVVAGNAVTIAITPRAADTSYRIYRGGDGIHNPATPMFIAEIKGPGNTTPFNFVDLNARIPGTSEAFGLSIYSQNSDAMFGARGFAVPRERLSMTNAPLGARNTVKLATLGPWLGVFDLAPILHTASRDLLFSAYTPVLTHPFMNVCWTNVGNRTGP